MVRDPGAAVMAAQVEITDAQRIHERRHVLGETALAVIAVIGQTGFLGRIAVAAKIGNHQKEISREALRDVTPHEVRLGESVQQQKRR